MAAQAYYNGPLFLILSSDYVHITGPVPTVDEVSLRLSLPYVLRFTCTLSCSSTIARWSYHSLCDRAPVSPPDDGLSLFF